MVKTEKQLTGEFELLYAMDDSPLRDSLNREIILQFRECLTSWDSFFYDWSNIKYAGIFTSQDNQVKIYSWYLENNSGEYDYYGFIQRLTGKKKNKQHIDVFGLHDHHRGVNNPETASMSDTSNWYGCLYYAIRSFQKRRDNWYVLFGYDFNTIYSHKKLLEVLTFDRKGNPVFGGNFITEKKSLTRYILEYSAELVMSLRYDEHLNMIVFDHIEPFQPIFKGNFRFYGPDGSYDGFSFDDGDFLYLRDVDARNY